MHVQILANAQIYTTKLSISGNFNTTLTEHTLGLLKYITAMFSKIEVLNVWFSLKKCTMVEDSDQLKKDLL